MENWKNAKNDKFVISKLEPTIGELVKDPMCKKYYLK
jgi:hypothetical protein